MGLKITSIDDLDPAVVEQAQSELSQLIQEKYPEIDLKRGVIHDIIAFFAGGISGGINQSEINRVLNSRSLLAIQQDPALADDELVDHVLSNYKITRKTGTRATGEITIVVKGDATVVIASNALYIANGINYRTNLPITARPTGSTITSDNDRVLEDRGDGTYEFTVPATAEDIGEIANINNNTKFIPEVAPARFVTAFSAGDFTGGIAQETNDELLTRMEAGIATGIASGRLNIESLIRSQAAFADIKNISIIGFGDPEMERDQHWIFPVSGGGRVDIYMQNDTVPNTVVIKKTATITAINENTATWQFSITKDDVPGFYYVADVKKLDSASDAVGFLPTYDLRGMDISDTEWTPDIVSIVEAGYTRYQTAVIQFKNNLDDVSGLSVGDTEEYNVSVLTQPLIGEIQDFLNEAENRHLASDMLVKSAVPCFVTIDCTITKNTNESSPDTTEITTAVAEAVNKLNFPGVLYASQITDIVHNYLTGTQAVSDIMLHGNIRTIGGDSLIIRDNQALTIPNSPSTVVTKNTTIFILYPENINISVINRN